jgi:hypothetical protein
MKLRGKVGIIAATIALVAGMTSVAMAQSDTAVGKAARDTGIMVSLGALITALGTQVQPIIRIYLDNQRLQFDVQTGIKTAASERHQILERIAYNESMIKHIYERLLPDEHMPSPPELPPDRIPSIRGVSTPS